MRCRAILHARRLAWVSAQGVLLTALTLPGWSDDAQAQDVSPRSVPGQIRDSALRTAADAPNIPPGPRGPDREDAGEAGVPRVEVAAVSIRTELPAVPGAQMVLQVDRGAVEGTRFRWFQVEGPPVEIDDPSQPSIQITIPKGAEQLGFVLVAAKANLVRAVRVIVPVQVSPSGPSVASEGTPARDSWGPRPSGKVRADAGDDQVGLVGHRVTLNGSRSIPGDGKTARWMQVGGPSVVAPQQQGPFFSFVPSSPGVYRFVLVVSGEGELSEPDEVTVLVGLPPAAPAAGPAVPPPVPSMGLLPSPAPPQVPTPEQLLASSLPRLANGARVVSEVADVMEAISKRAPLYSSFADLQNELSRRLDVVIPSEPLQRASWNQGVFQPLTAYTAVELLASGLDLRQPQRLQHPLTPAQQERLGEHFQKLRGRSAVPTAR